MHEGRVPATRSTFRRPYTLMASKTMKRVDAQALARLARVAVGAVVGRALDLDFARVLVRRDRRVAVVVLLFACLLYTSPSPRDKRQSRMPSSA